jgi:hypothetical protein
MVAESQVSDDSRVRSWLVEDPCMSLGAKFAVSSLHPRWSRALTLRSAKPLDWHIHCFEARTWMR